MKIISLEESVSILESDSLPTKVDVVNINKNIPSNLLIDSDKQKLSNYFTPLRPQGVIIIDSYNNPFFPVPYPRVDNDKFTTSSPGKPGCFSAGMNWR